MRRLVLTFVILLLITSLGCTSFVRRHGLTWNKKAYITFFNPSIHIGKVSIEPLNSNKYTQRIRKSKSIHTTSYSYRLVESKAKTNHYSVNPGEPKRVLLKPGYYLISMSTNKGHRIKIQVAGGNIYDMHGHKKGTIIRLPKASNEPGYGSFELNVINN